MLQDYPFDRDGSIVELFKDDMGTARKIIRVIDEINGNAQAMQGRIVLFAGAASKFGCCSGKRICVWRQLHISLFWSLVHLYLMDRPMRGIRQLCSQV